MVRPYAPFSSWPIQRHDPDVGFAWYFRPCTLVTQVSADTGTVHRATMMCDWIDAIISEHHGEIVGAGGLLALHDWRRLLHYESAARAAWLERIRKRPKGYLRKAIVVVGDRPLIKMAVAGGNLLSALAGRGGAPIELSSNIHAVLREYEITPPMEKTRVGLRCRHDPGGDLAHVADGDADRKAIRPGGFTNFVAR